MLTFDLNEKEQKKYFKFLKSLTKKYRNKLCKFIFVETGIGTHIEVKIGKKKKDITDYRSW